MMLRSMISAVLWVAAARAGDCHIPSYCQGQSSSHACQDGADDAKGATAYNESEAYRLARGAADSEVYGKSGATREQIIASYVAGYKKRVECGDDEGRAEDGESQKDGAETDGA